MLNLAAANKQVRKEMLAKGINLCVSVEVVDDGPTGPLAMYYPDDNVIQIPTRLENYIRLSRALRQVMGYAPEVSLRKVLRHEYGHALIDIYGLKRRECRSFGKPPYVTVFSDSSWAEDFCESFAYWLVNKPMPKPKKEFLDAL